MDASREPDAETDKWAREVIAAAIEVHTHLGPGFLESIYARAMEIEFRLRGIPFVRHPSVEVRYKGQDVGGSQLDFLVGGLMIVELKAVDALAPIHLAQTISYLKATSRHLALLINFKAGLIKTGIRRVILS